MKPFITQAVDEIVRGPVTGLLKPLGFRRKAQRFWRSVGRSVQLLEIERWKYNEADLGGFRAIAGVFYPEAWALWTEVRPDLADMFSATEPQSQNCEVDLYLDSTETHADVPHGYWPVSTATDLAATGAAFVTQLQTEALPWLDANSQVTNVLAALGRQSDGKNWHAGARLFFLACVTGEGEIAAASLTRVVARPVHNPSFPRTERDAFLRIATLYGVKPG
jgi:hypothetical protein